MPEHAKSLHGAKPHGPNPGIVAIIFTVLYLASLVPVTLIVSTTHFPSPFQPAEEVTAFFRTESIKVRICAFLQFCSTVPLGIFTATMVSLLSFHGARAAGVAIGLFGGVATSILVALSALLSWVITQPGITDDATLTRALNCAIFAFGGPGYSTLIGLLFLGISIPSGFMRLLPKWTAVLGITLGIIGELSSLTLVFPSALFLIPLTRFPGFVWMIAVGFKLSRTAV